MKPILEDAFYHDGRGPSLHRVVWNTALPCAFEYFNPDDPYNDDHLKHLLLVRVEAFASAGEEVHGDIVRTQDSRSAIHDLGQSPWLQSFNPRHLDKCSHFRIEFYDEIFDVICEDVQAIAGGFVKPSRNQKKPWAAPQQESH